MHLNNKIFELCRQEVFELKITKINKQNFKFIYFYKIQYLWLQNGQYNNLQYITQNIYLYKRKQTDNKNLSQTTMALPVTDTILQLAPYT